MPWPGESQIIPRMVTSKKKRACRAWKDRRVTMTFIKKLSSSMLTYKEKCRKAYLSHWQIFISHVRSLQHKVQFPFLALHTIDQCPYNKPLFTWAGFTEYLFFTFKWALKHDSKLRGKNAKGKNSLLCKYFETELE